MSRISQVEIARSFSQKKNLGNYETQDYFASYKATIQGDPSADELQTISDLLAEKAENDVISKIDPTKFISRQVTLAELKSKLKTAMNKIEELEKIISKQKPF